MQLTGLSLANYKAFKKPYQVDIRPLTIVIGKNSSGKSALARLPLLLGRALSDEAEAPLDLAFADLDFGGSFRDLVHNRLHHASVGLGAMLEGPAGERVRFDARVQDIFEFRLQLVSEFNLDDGAGLSIRCEWTAENPVANVRRFRITGSLNGLLDMGFSGIWPTKVASPPDGPEPLDPAEVERLQSRLDELRALAASATSDMAHLGPFRERPARSYRFPGRMPKGVGMATGKNAPAVLGADLYQKQGVLPAVSKWFSENMGGWELGIAEVGTEFEVVLQRREGETLLQVNLVDVGQGMSQVLPLVVQRKYHEIISSPASVEIIEQPELHLHPAVHGAVASIYADSVLNGNVRFVIETHSENFVLRIRRLVAQKLLTPEQVVIYSVEDTNSGSDLRKINVSEDGEVDYWPQGVFSEDFEEVRLIRRAQRGLSVEE